MLQRVLDRCRDQHERASYSRSNIVRPEPLLTMHSIVTHGFTRRSYHYPPWHSSRKKLLFFETLFLVPADARQSSG